MAAVPRYTIKTQQFWSDRDLGIYVHRIPAQGEIASHDHVFHEIVYVESGTADHQTASATRRLRPGDLIVIRPQIWHAYRNSRALGIINCLFDRRVVQRFAPLLARLDGAFELFQKPVRHPAAEAPEVLHVRPAQRPTLVARFQQMMAEQEERGAGWEAALAASLLDVLVVTARLSRRQQLRDESAPATIHLSGRTDQAVLDTATHLESTYTQPVSLPDLAARVKVSPAHLSRNFTKRMGMGVVEFVHRLRCEEACRLLRWTAQPIGEIATRVGYDEIAYFSRCFRVQIGQSPRKYRRASRASGTDMKP
jgi:AraC-like DNA-binding protein